MRMYTILCLFVFMSNQIFSQCCINYKDVYSSDDIINTYYPPVPGSIVEPGSTRILLNPVPDEDQFGNSYGAVPITAGDLLLIIQMQGAEFDPNDAVEYGSGTSSSGPDSLGGTGYKLLNNVGVYEFVMAQNDVPLTGGELIINSACTVGGIKNRYTCDSSSPGVVKQVFQVIRVSAFLRLRLEQDLSTTAWNGSVGGVLALIVSDTLDLNGFTISADGKGFRGGFQMVRGSGSNNEIYTTTDINISSGKGEGISGTPRFLWNGKDAVDNGKEWYGYEGGNYGRGAPGNAGGGGNNHNAGGGGGGGYGGGGVGGNGWAGAGANFPNGGRPGDGLIERDRIFFGGGGGGGDANDARSGIKGGAGGGVIFILSGFVTGNGTVSSSGLEGQYGIYGSQPDGAGGGGGGGTVVFYANQISDTSIIIFQANGGAGGNTLNDLINPHGPGGGGGGGYIVQNIIKDSNKINVEGGISGKTDNGKGNPHGAKDGQKGGYKIYDFGLTADDFKISSSPDVIASFDILNASGCSPFEVTFDNKSGVNKKYFWDFGDMNTDTIYAPTRIYLHEGSYNVRLIVVDSNSCNITDTSYGQVIVKRGVIADFEYDMQPCNLIATFANTSSDSVISTWNLGDGTFSLLDHPEHKYSYGGMYEVKLHVTNMENECPDSISQILTFPSNPFTRLEIPNVFTPNNDGLNDCFTILGISEECENGEIEIFNRWGIKVYSGSITSSCWNGRLFNEGEELPSGTYFYVIETNRDGKGGIKTNGVIHLIRSQ
jgi:gliding motility-associated-like protein